MRPISRMYGSRMFSWIHRKVANRDRAWNTRFVREMLLRTIAIRKAGPFLPTRKARFHLVSLAVSAASTTFPNVWSVHQSSSSLSAISQFDNDDKVVEIMPLPPHSYKNATSPSISVVVDLSQIAEKVKLRETRRQEAFQFSRKIQVALVRAQDAVWNADPDEEESMNALRELMEDPILQQNSGARGLREANLSIRMEDYVRLLAFRHFLATSKLLPPPPSATDEEYLAGACMLLAQDLQRYALGRATVRDSESIQAASTLVSDILDFLLQMDFRNGPLRRKYDGTKWCLRALETLLYELAITSGGDPKEDKAPHSKRPKHESILLPNEELASIKTQMEHRDNLRERLIKLCRDAQKAAKQSIFALHRGDLSRAATLIETCETCITKDLMPIIQEEPNLRSGSFAAVLEEYIEARLFSTWIGSDPTSPTGEIVSETGFVVDVEPEEYVGGLCDLTGEVGRFAVQRGTVRDSKSVQLCLQTNQAVLSALQMMEHSPIGGGKKLDPVRNSVDKLQRMLYEMSLSEAAGGRNVKSDIEMEDVDTQENDQS